jgi:hypothetical protein
MGTDKLSFAGEQWGATGSDVAGSDVSYVTGSDITRTFFSILISPSFFSKIEKKKNIREKY